MSRLRVVSLSDLAVEARRERVGASTRNKPSAPTYLAAPAPHDDRPDRCSVWVEPSPAKMW